MRVALTFSLILALGAPVQAGSCHGKNLITALPPADLRALRAQADGPFDQGNFWQARKDGQVMTLVGTYHLSDPRFETTLDAIAPYLAQAKALLVEAGPTEQAALQGAVQRDPSLMYITTGPTLPDQVPAKDWAQIARAADARGVSSYAAATMQPWLLASVLDLPACLFPLPPGADRGLDKR